RRRGVQVHGMLTGVKGVGVVETTDLLNKILDATKEGVLVVAPGLNLVAGNHPAELAFHIPPGELKQHLVSDFIQDKPVLQAFYRASWEGKTSDLHLKIGPKGNRRRYDVHVAPLELDGVPHAIGFFYDVTQVH